MSKEMDDTISAYEKMCENGTAFKKIDMTMSNEPDLGEAMGKKVTSNVNSSPLGEANMNQMNNVQEDYTDYSEFDNHMESRINALRNKMKGGISESGMNKVGKLMTPAQKEIQALKARVAKLEEALIIVMEAQAQIFE
jgi:hypothetical protein